MRLYAVTERRPSGVGTMLWVGELRTEDGNLIREHLDGHAHTHLIAPVSVGATEEEVIESLERRALALRKQGR